MIVCEINHKQFVKGNWEIQLIERDREYEYHEIKVIERPMLAERFQEGDSITLLPDRTDIVLWTPREFPLASTIIAIEPLPSEE
jgi:hypothetical protein